MAKERNTLGRNAVLAAIMALAAAVVSSRYGATQRRATTPKVTEGQFAGAGSKSLPACRSHQIVWSLPPPNKSPSGYLQSYVLQNDSNTACTLDGTPSAYESDLAGHQSLSYISSPNLPRLVTLQPSARASFSIGFFQCRAYAPVSTTGPLMLTLSIPGTDITAQFDVSAMGEACTSAVAQISPIASGPISPG